MIECLISVLIFESVDEMLRFDHSNETSSATLSVGVFASKHFTKKKKLEIWPYFDNWATSRIEKVLCLSHALLLPNKARSFSISSYFV